MERIELLLSASSPVSTSGSLCESEDDSVSSASPMSISSSEACSPYTEESEDAADSTFTDSFSNESTCSSPSTSFSSSTISSSSSTTTPSYDNRCSYNPCAKSVRWYRDERGLFELSRNPRLHRTPYQRQQQQHQLRHTTTTTTKDSCQLLIEAVQRQDVSEIRNILNKHSINLNVLGSEGDSPLHRSCRQGNLELVQLLVSHLRRSFKSPRSTISIVLTISVN